MSRTMRASHPENIQHELVHNALKLAKIFGGEGFDGIMPDDVNNFIEAHSETLTEECLLKLTKSDNEEEGKAPDPVEDEDKLHLTIERLSELLGTATELQRKSPA